jgi:hypothetical protein
MAMNTCSDCNGQISDSAQTCPHCGCLTPLVGQQPRKVGVLLGIGIFLFPMIFSWFTLREGHSGDARIFAFTWLVVSMMMSFGGMNHVGSIQSASHTTRASLDGSTTATDIAQAYNENAFAADQKFKGKRFSITGSVVEVNTYIADDSYVTLKGGVNQSREPHFGFEKSSPTLLFDLNKGTAVTLLCTGRGIFAKTPMWDSCTLQSVNSK